MGKRQFSERDICSKFITPALIKSGWDLESQIREEVSFTNGRIFVNGKIWPRQLRNELFMITSLEPV